MPTAAKSPKSAQRKRVMSAYRGRGHQNADLWLHYSYKTKRDWIVASDHQLVHWLTYLETDSEVKSFDLAPESSPFESSERNVVKVERRDGTVEWQTIQPDVDGTETQLTLPSTRVLVISYSDLKERALAAVRWLKPISYVTAIREQPLVQIHSALVAVIKTQQAGIISDVIKAMNGFDPHAVIGVLVRLHIVGWVNLDVASQKFNLSTLWRSIEGGDDVVT